MPSEVVKTKEFTVSRVNGDMKVGLCQIDRRKKIPRSNGVQNSVESVHLEPVINYIPVQSFEI